VLAAWKVVLYALHVHLGLHVQLTDQLVSSTIIKLIHEYDVADFEPGYNHVPDYDENDDMQELSCCDSLYYGHPSAGSEC